MFTFDEITEVAGQEMLVGTAPLVPLIAIGMMLTMAGVYGVLAFAITRRSRELAVRVAIGATAGDLDPPGHRAQRAAARDRHRRRYRSDVRAVADRQGERRRRQHLRSALAGVRRADSDRRGDRPPRNMDPVAPCAHDQSVDAAALNLVASFSQEAARANALRAGGPLFSRSEARLPAESRQPGSLESRRTSSQRPAAPG